MPSSLSDAERARYEWQLWSDGFGEAGQAKLKSATVLVSRIGGVGGVVAHQFAAAGVGRLLLAHAGQLKPSDLNRQLLMSSSGLGQSRVEQAAQLLRQFNPHLDIVPISQNISEVNAEALVADVDLVACCAPLFSERLAMNSAAVKFDKPLVDAAMFDGEVQLTTVIPGQSPCLACLYPEPSTHWKREFPVFGAVAGTVGAMAAFEIIKLLTGLGDTLAGKLLIGDLRSMRFRTLEITRRPDCPICSQR